MSLNEIVYLMYHELERPNRSLCNSITEYKHYVVTESDFRKQINRLNELGYVGLSVSDAASSYFQDKKRLVVTFDDGCETDLIIAAPILKEFNFNATFYVIAGHIGQNGYLSADQVKELSDLGFEIGSHSMTHRYLSDLSTHDLLFEIKESKNQLEQIIGKEITHFSCPGGRWNEAVIKTVKESGYQSMATSHIGTNNPYLNTFSLPRFSILRDMKIRDFDKICSAEGLAKLQLKDAVFSFAKDFFGNSMYDKIRSKIFAASSFYKS
jgi:peptidoglycan/xylan/chitin deacetylase (PgdA/CDA1 family)